MNTSYIYSATRVTARGENLLNRTDIERLLVAAPGAELQTALKETYVAPYVLEVVDEHMPEAIEATLIEAKKLIHRIAPHGDIFRVLWVQYDIHNLRVFAKATRQQHSYDAVATYVSRRGIYEPRELYEHVVAGTLHHLQPGWQAAYDAAVALVTAGKLDEVDQVFDELVFTDMKRYADISGDVFIKRYVANVIDLHNLKQQLRRWRLPATAVKSAWISGGNISASAVSDIESLRIAFEQLAAGHFTSALATYEATGNTTELDARCDDFLVTFAKDASIDLFSSASLVLYYLRVRQAAANIRTIVVGRNSSQSIETIRANLRLAYVNN